MTDTKNELLTKVFVGNLSFKTKENQLAEEFSSAGQVVSANIITRGPRSLGYGFVEMGSEADAQKAVQLMNKKEIDGREINVEVANPRDPQAPKERPPKTAGGSPNAGSSPAAGGERGGRGGSRGGFRGGRGGRFRGRGGARGGFAGRGAGGAGGAPREGGDVSPAAERAPSTTTLFVANLPFSVDDNGLTELFKAYNPKKAHVVRKRNDRSKGFGFVEFENESDQRKALEGVDKKVIDGRDLSVKVALTEDKAAAEANGTDEKKADA